MALDIIIQDSDTVQFLTPCGGALVQVPSGIKIEASGKTTINGKKVCVKGDEEKVIAKGCSYTMPPFVEKGTGTLKIMKLVPDQLTKKAASGGKPIILKGKLFIAIFEVQSPAKMLPPTNTPDPVPFYIGQGKFIPGNNKIKAS